MTLPQLRLRTEFSFRKAYGQIDKVAARLAEMGCRSAGIVDEGTWGHVRWEKALTKVGVQPLFGVALPVPRGDLKPLAWALAEDTKAFYQFVSGVPSTQDEWATAKGIIRFAGAGLTDPAAFDYIDLNPASRYRRKQALALAKSTQRPIIVTSDNSFPARKDASQFLAICDGQKMTPQWICSEDELRASMPDVPPELWPQIIANTHEVAERLQGIKLAKAPLIHLDGDLRALALAGKETRLARGHIREWTEVYEARLHHELEQIAAKDFDAYFLVVSDLVRWAKQRMLVGPARGSSAGSLVCYLTDITEVDPIVHQLLFERFIDVTRADLPDIDIDFPDTQRDQVFVYLADKYGAEQVARIGNVNTLKPRSVIAEVGKRIGIPVTATFAIKNVIVEYSSGDSRYGKGLEDTLDNTAPGREMKAKYPACALMTDVENHAWHTGVHAAGVIVCNEPVADFCCTKAGVAQLDKPDAEYLGLLKIDALGLRTLGVIEDTGCVTPDQMYGLSLDDPEVMTIFNAHKYSGIFQFEGATQRQVAAQIPFTGFTAIDHVTALARPGPLGGGATHSYIRRNNGEEADDFIHPLAEPYIRDTHGVLLYQEQIMFIGRNLGNLSWKEVTLMRKAMSGRKGEEFFGQLREAFMRGATANGMPDVAAANLWNSMVTFGAWGMNRSHTVSYAIISYWCAFMKRYHPLEYAAACLRNAKDDEQAIEILRELSEEGIGYEPFDIEHSEMNWAVRNGKLLGGWTNLAGVGPAKAVAFLEKRRLGTLTDKDIAKIDKLPRKFSELRPAHALWQHIYDDPAGNDINGRIKEFAGLQDQDNAVVIFKVVQRTRRDENEAVLIKRRNGEVKQGQTLFLDVFAVDDSISKPACLRIRPKNWERLGVKMADYAVDNVDWFLARGRWLGQFNMMIVDKLRCLNRPEFFDA